MKTWVGSVVRILGVVAAGGVGAVCTLYINRTEASVSQPASRAASADQPKDSLKEPRATGALAKRLSGLEQRIGALEEAPAQAEEAKEPNDTQQASAEEHLDAPPASFYYEQHDKNIAQHKSERMDPDWGPRSSKALRADAERLATFGRYSINEVECRDETCRVNVHWEKFSTARTSYEELLHQPLAMSCGRSIVIPEVAADESVDATLLLDCAEWKANGSELLDLSKSLPTVPPPAE
jgi:hypothetical protein